MVNHDSLKGKYTMTENILKFTPQIVGEGFRIDPDQILEEAKGKNFSRLMIIADDDLGKLYVAGSANAGECMILMELAKRRIVDG
jgi:hypothetical protein